MKDCPIPEIAEGGIWTLEQLKHVFELGAYSAVVGTTVKNPMDVTIKIVEAVG